MHIHWLRLGTAQPNTSQTRAEALSVVGVYLAPKVLWVMLIMTLIFSITPPGTAQQNANPAVIKTIAEAELHATAHTNNLTWFALGCVGGPIPMTAAFFRTAPSPALLLGKSPGYVDQYTKAYKAKARNLRLKYATIGALGGITISGLLFYFRYDISDWLYWNL